MHTIDANDRPASATVMTLDVRSRRLVGPDLPAKQQIDDLRPTDAAISEERRAPLDRRDLTSAILFGPFRLYPAMRLLEKDGVQVALRGRALDILICLAERAGEVVSRKEIDATVWPDMTVVDGCLRFHVVMLRKALGDTAAHSRYIANVPGRGYCFVARVARDAEHADLLPAFRAPSSSTIDTGPGALGRTPDREPLLRKLG